jgi:hypothetical protein
MILAPTGRRLARLARMGWTAARAAGPKQLARLALGAQGAVVQIENTNHCNFHCAYCPTHAPGAAGEVTRGHMTQETFARILDENPRALLAVIQGQGEPLMDPGVFAKIAAARARRLVTQVISNGSLLGPAMIERLRREGPDVFLVSLDARSPEENEQERAGMRFSRVLEGLRALIAARARAARPMAVGILSIVPGPFGAETERALRRYDALGVDVLFYKQLNGAYAERIRGYRAPPIDGVPLRVRASLSFPLSHQRIAAVRPCPQLAHDFPYYLWDGRRTACCVLNAPHHAAPEYARERLLARYAERRMPAACEACSYFAGYGRSA